MALFFESKTTPAMHIAIWKTEETLDELCQLLSIHKSTLPDRAESRQKEWLVIRILLKKLLHLDEIPGLEYDENGKPRLADKASAISISHTREFVGVMMSTKKLCGIDLELISPRIEKIAPRFLSEDEKSFITKEKLLHYLYVIWGAKEVLFKLYSKGNILFKDNFRIDPFQLEQKGNVNAHIQKEKYTKSYTIHYETIGDLMLTYAME